MHPRTLPPCDLILILAFWLAGGFERLDVLVRGLGFGPIVTGTLHLGALVLAQLLVGLPFRWYSTFVIEERFGFNRTTTRTFVLDELKSLLLTALLGGPLLAAVLWFFDQTGNAAWLWCAGLASAFLVIVQFVAPMWILPLFHTFKRLDPGDLERAVRDYAAHIGFPIEGLFVIDGSRRSTRANAFLTGFGSRKRIALFDTLLQQHSIPEIVSVVAHEIGHVRRRHILKELGVAIVQVVLAFFLLSVVLRDARLFEAFSVSTPSTHAGLALFALAYTPIGLAWSLISQARSRANEYEADAFARTTTGDGEALAGALEKVSAETLTNLTPHPLFVALHFDHPPIPDRVAALRPGLTR